MIVVDLVRIAATKRRIRLMQHGKRCSDCGGRFDSPGCVVGFDRKPAHVRYCGVQKAAG